MTPVDPTSAVPTGPAVAVPQRLLQDGEEVVLALKPGGFFVLFISTPVILGAVAALMLGYLMNLWFPLANIPLSTLAGFCLAGVLVRLVIACLQWLSRLYVLTDKRIIRVKGVLNVQVFECRLEQVQNTFMALSLPERFVGMGTLYFATAGTGGPEAAWLMINRPREVHEVVVSYIERAHRLNHNGL